MILIARGGLSRIIPRVSVAWGRASERALIEYWRNVDENNYTLIMMIISGGGRMDRWQGRFFYALNKKAAMLRKTNERSFSFSGANEFFVVLLNDGDVDDDDDERLSHSNN